MPGAERSARRTPHPGDRTRGPGRKRPIFHDQLMLGTWQQLVLLDFDDRPRERTVVVQVSS